MFDSFLDAYYIKEVHIIAIDETTSKLSCQYKPFSDPNGCKITIGCANYSDDDHRQYVIFADNNNSNSSSSEEVIFRCADLKCPLYSLYAYDIHNDSEHSASENPAVMDTNIALCKENPCTLI